MSYDPALLKADLIQDLDLDEGVRLKLYYDSRDIPSIGCGRNLEAEGISLAEEDFMLANDLASHEADLDRELPWWRQLDEPRARVLVNLCFNMGITTLMEFTTFLGYLKENELELAADDLEHTAWYGQVGQRGPRMIARLTATQGTQS